MSHFILTCTSCMLCWPIKLTIFLQLKDGDFSFLNNPNDLDPYYKTDLDILDCFERKNNLSYSHRDTVRPVRYTCSNQG